MKRVSYLIFAFIASVMLSSCYDPYYYDYVDAGFYTKEDTYLVGEEIQFYNNSDNADSFFWDFGDDENSSMINPSHIYTEAGEYEVKLSAYGRDGKDVAYSVITIVSDDSPTSLNVLVKYFGTEDVVSNCPVFLYDSETNWSNFQNAIDSLETGVEGEVEFGYLEPQIYWIDAFKSINDSCYYSNEKLGVATDALIEGTVNYYDVFVELLYTSSGSKIYVIRDIEKSSYEERCASILEY